MRMFLFLVLAGTVACSKQMGDPFDKNNSKPTAYKMDQVKYINKDIFDTRDASSVGMAQYPIHENGRMLIRFSGFRREVGKILTQQPILLRLSVGQEDLVHARLKLQICPITKNWMTFATWQKAHIHGGGDWAQPGGDFDPFSCQVALNLDDAIFKDGREEKTFCTGEGVLCFNIGPWFQSYVQERGTDLGLIVINESSQIVRVAGDGSNKYPTVFMRLPY